MAAAFFAASPALADKTISENTTLTADTDWSDQGTVTIAEGVTLDLNGYTLKVASINGAGGIVDSLAAAGYERLEYIASTGNQYIDTEDRHNAKTVVDMRLQFTKLTPSYQAYYGARISGERGDQFSGWVTWTSSKCLFRYGYGVLKASNYEPPSVTTDMILDIHLAKSGQCTVVTNGVASNPLNIGSGDSSNSQVPFTDFLFAINQLGSGYNKDTKAPNFWTQAKMYSCVIQQDGGIAHNFIPAKRLSDEAIGMYDSVTKKFHDSPNGNKFNKGPVVAHGLRLTPSGDGAASDFSGLTIGEGVPLSFVGDGALPAALDVTKFASVEVAEGATLDLAGHNLTVNSITGDGLVTDTVGTALAGYDRYEYLQAEQKNAGNLYAARNSIQYIDTGYRHNGTTKVEMRLVFTQVSYPKVSNIQDGNYAAYYGARNNDNTYKPYDFGGWLMNGKIANNGTAGGVGASTTDSPPAEVDRTYDVVLDKGSGAKSSMSWDGGSYEFSTGNGGDGTPRRGTTVLTDYIFAINQYDDSYWPNFPCRMKCYSCKIYDKKDASGNTVSDYILQRDFVPVRRKSDNKPGMLDLAGGGFYTNMVKTVDASSPDFKTPDNPMATVPGGELRIVVAEGATASLGDMAKIAGTVKVVKTGAGTLTLPASGHSFAGGLEVAGGTLSMTQTPDWLQNTPIEASAGGMIEVAAADGASYANDFTLAGGTLKAIASGTGDTTTATIAGTLALETGANDEQPTVLVDTTGCTSGTIRLETTALTVGTGVAAAPGFVSFSDATMYEASIDGGTAIKVVHLTEPEAAVWTGAAEDDDFDNAGNWTCYNKKGAELDAGTLPDFGGSTTNIRLAASADWTGKNIALGADAVLDLAGNNLTVASITGSGSVVDTVGTALSGYDRLDFIQADRSMTQYIDTGYVHDNTTIVDMRIQFDDVSQTYQSFYGARNSKADAAKGFSLWLNNAVFRTAFGTGSAINIGGHTVSKSNVYDIHLEKTGVCTATPAGGDKVELGNGVRGDSLVYNNIGYTDYLFVINQYGDVNGKTIWSPAFPTSAKLYSCKIHSGTTLVRDFVPVKRKADNAAGMLDLVEGKFYGNAGGGSFTQGSIVETTPGGELHIAVAEGATASLGDMAKISGTIKVVKEGAGTLTLPANGTRFTGGLEVAAGTLSVTPTPVNFLKTTITATAGGTIALAASDGAVYTNGFALAGGTLKVLASGTGATTTAAIDGTLALALGANDAQPNVSVDMTDCSSTTFILNTTVLTVGEGVAAAPGYIEADATLFEASVDGTAIKIERVGAPVTAVWTGAANDNNLGNAANWTCYNKNGATLANTTLPDDSTTSYRLAADADWSAQDFALGAGVTLDLAGHTLTADSVTGSGVVIDSSDNFITASDGSVYQKIQYVQATQEGANNSGSGQSDGKPKIQYVDTEYYHVGTTKVDIRVEFQDVSYSGNYGYATYYGCRNNGDDATHQLGGWLHNSKFYYYDTSEHDGAAAYTGRIYDIRLDKGGSSYANYADGTLASTLGTGNGAGESNTYGTDYIFANNQVWNDGKYWPCKCRVYSCKVYTGDTPERDFVPVRRVSGTNAGEAGFWCNVTKKFYGNSGYGSLTAGPAVQSETAGRLHIVVPAETSAALGDMAKIAGNVKVVKEGAGAMTLPADGQYFTGGLEVAAGTLAMTQTAKFLAGTPVVGSAGGVIEVVAADGAIYTNDFTVAGGTLKVLASGAGDTTTATIDGTLALEKGANDEQPTVSIDMASCTGAMFVLNTTALTAGTGVVAAPGFVATSDATMFETSVDGNAIKVESLATAATAVWTGEGEPGNFNDPENWSCTNKYGTALAGTTVPGGMTTTFRLGANADWTAKGALTLGEGVTLDLNGNSLTATSVSGDGMIVDGTGNFIFAPDGSVYQKVEYVRAVQEGAFSSSGGVAGKIQYVDTGYSHNGTTKVDIRILFHDTVYTGVGYASYYGCRDIKSHTTSQLGGWLSGGLFRYYTIADGVNSTVNGDAASAGVIYDIHLDKGGESYANYGESVDGHEAGTLASSLGTGNGTCESSEYGTDYIFAINQIDSGSSGRLWPCNCQVYSCKIYTGDTLERDFVPVRCISGANAGEAGFWCTVKKDFYGNSGYGSLTAGPAVEGATAGELRITAAEGQTLSLASMPTIAGNIKVVKGGAGTLVAPATGHWFTGGIKVEAGTLSMGGALAYGGAIAAAAGTTVSVPASVGSAGTSTVAMAGGAFEIAGCCTANAAGTATLGGGAISFEGSFAPVSGSAACAVTLAGTTTLDFTQWTGALPAEHPAFSFASGANITLKLSPATEAIAALAKSRDPETLKFNGYLLEWDAIPSGVEFGLDSASAETMRLRTDGTGVRVSFKTGISLIVL